jgi:hypothetical protein
MRLSGDLTFAKEKVRIDFYVMSWCPYGMQVVNSMGPVLKELGQSVDFRMFFIGTKSKSGKLSSLHGQGELEEDLRQVCAMKYYSDAYLYMDYIICRNGNIRSAKWESCAQKNGMDVQTLRECSEGAQGQELLSESIRASKAMKATGSPTMYIDGKRYNGNRGPLDFKAALCEAMDTKAQAC